MKDETDGATWEGRSGEAWRDAWGVPRVQVHASTTSTNDVGLRLASAGAAPGTTALADRQTRGRGREGRSWIDSEGHSLLMSVVFRGAADADPSIMPLRVGLAVAQAIEAVCGARVRLKWPNDLLAEDGRKLGGILCEGATGGGQTWLVAGIGLNVGQTEDDFDPALRSQAASIRMLGGACRRHELAGRVLDQLRPFRIQSPPLGGVELAALRRRDALLGREVTIDGTLAGTADGIAPDGTLRLRRDGVVTRIRSGTVRFRSRAGAEDAAAGSATTRAKAAQ